MHRSNRQLFQEYMALPSVVTEPIEIVKSEGIYLYDLDGKRYVDLVSGVSVSNTGHRHPRVVAAIKEQLDQYMHLMVYGKFVQAPQVQMARLMAEHLPSSLQSVFFVNSGSEAIEGALKLAKRVTGRSRMLSFNKAYHGSTHGAMSMLGHEEMKYAYRPLLPDIQFLDFNDKDQLSHINEEVACVLVEPVQAEAGIIIPDKEYMSALRNKCNETGTLLIFDEVQMGFGRTGKLFAFEHFNIVPDILCLAKGMGGGMPVGAFVASKQHMDTLTHHPALGHITTFGGHPVSCAAALASLQVILEDELHLKAHSKGRLFSEALIHHPTVKEIRQIGLMIGVELYPDHHVYTLLKLFQKNGLIVDQFLFNEHSFRIAPPLTITQTEISDICKTLVLCLDQL